MPDLNVLHACFLQAWTIPGFADEIVRAPRAGLDHWGLGVGDDVAVAVFSWRTDSEHLCRRCQLPIPGVYVTLGPGRPGVASRLDMLFTDPRAPADPRARLDAHGIAVADNVRVTIEAGPSPRVELQLCAAHHVCLCDAPELEPIVFANWPG